MFPAIEKFSRWNFLKCRSKMCHSLAERKKTAKKDAKKARNENFLLISNGPRNYTKEFRLKFEEIAKLIKFTSRDKGRHNEIEAKSPGSDELFFFPIFIISTWHGGAFFPFSFPEGICFIGFSPPTSSPEPCNRSISLSENLAWGWNRENINQIFRKDISELSSRLTTKKERKSRFVCYCHKRRINEK